MSKYELENGSIEAQAEPAAVIVQLSPQVGLPIWIRFEGQTLMMLERACCDALGIKYEVFKITGMKDPEPGAAT